MQANDYSQIERITPLRSKEGHLGYNVGKPTMDGKNQTSDSEKFFQREAQPYDQRYFRPRVEDANKNGRTRARQMNRVETKLLGVGECDVNHRPVFYVGPEDNGPINGTQRYVIQFCTAGGNVLEINNNGIFVNCPNSGRRDLCDVIDQLVANGTIQ